MNNFYIKYPKFDWKYYIQIYPDLQRANINTEIKAINHYLSYGLQEKRNTHQIKIKDKTFSVEFNIFTNMCKQIYISSSLVSFRERFLKKFNLQNYNNLQMPSFFFGCYTTKDLIALNNHQQLKILIWGGEDCNTNNLHSLKTIDQIKKMNNIIHISISECIYLSLKKNNINSILVDFNLVDTNIFKPLKNKKVGKKIFIFNGQQKGRTHIYGEKYYKQVIRNLPQFKFIFSNELNAKWCDMPDIYAQCFIMLRLTNHDGNANSVQECKAMNIPVIHNHSKYGLKWKNVNDIIFHIKNNIN